MRVKQKAILYGGYAIAYFVFMVLFVGLVNLLKALAFTVAVVGGAYAWYSFVMKITKGANNESEQSKGE